MTTQATQPAPTIVPSASREVSAHARAMYGMAFFSGIAALLYQVVWVHMLTLSFGSTTIGAGVTIASFMAGLGLGARAYELLQARMRNALRLYAGIEIGIAVSAIVISLGLYQLPGIYAQISHSISNGFLLNSIRVAASFGILIIPSFLIGATFPALCTAMIRTRGGVPRHLGTIYGVNTMGAALGTLLAGFILVEQIGNLATVWVAAALNTIVALVAFAVSRRTTDSRLAPQPADEQRSIAPSQFDPRILALALAVSGFATMSFEIVWMRALRYLIGNSTYATSLVLAVFLVGLAIGGLLYRPLVRRFQADSILTVSLIVSGFLALLSVGTLALILSLDSTAGMFSIFSTKVRFLPWPQRLLLSSSVATVLLLPATIAMGLIFPVASSLMVERISVMGRRIGSAYLHSTIGSIAGVLLAAMVILPQLGVTGGTRLIATLPIAAGLALMFMTRQRSFAYRGSLATVAILGTVLIVLFPTRMPFRGEQEGADNRNVVFWEEGEQSTVKVIERATDGARAMTVDGYLIGVSQDWRREAAFKQLALAHLPMALRPDAKRTLNIGLGSATTLASLGRYTSIDLLDCVEISAAVVHGARAFDDGATLDDQRTNIVVDDAIHFLLRSEAAYDVIISDGKQNPQFPGNSRLLARDFYELSLSRLSPNGVFVQWIPANLPPHAFQMVLKSFFESFPHSAAYFYPPSCLILAGSPSAIRPGGPLNSRDVEMQDWAAAELQPYNIGSRELLLAGYVCSGENLVNILGDAGTNSWDHPHLEFIPYKEWEASKNRLYYYENTGLLIKFGTDSIRSGRISLPASLIPAFESAAIMRIGYLDLIRSSDPDSLRPYCERALQINPADSLAAASLRAIPRGLRDLMIPGQSF